MLRGIRLESPGSNICEQTGRPAPREVASVYSEQWSVARFSVSAHQGVMITPNPPSVKESPSP